MTSRLAPTVLAAALALALSACGRDDAGEAETAVAGDVAATQAEADAAPADESAGGAADAATAGDDTDASRPLEVAELDAYARGVRHEIEQLKPKVAAVEAARANNDDAAETAALLAMTMSIDEEAARAAGVTPARWGTIRAAIDEVLTSRQMADAMKPQIEAMEAADTSGYTEEQKAQLAQNIADMKSAWGDPYAKLPPEVAEAMKPREAELAALRNEAFALRVRVL
jgi:hypothetical protein